MPRYSAPLARSALSTTLGVGSIEAPGASQRRIKIFNLIFSSVASPVDITALWRLIRSTTASTGGSSVTPSLLDLADSVAAVTLAKQALTVEGTTGALVVYEKALNQRASFEWKKHPDTEGLVIPATAAAGIIAQTPTVNGIGAPAAAGGNLQVWFEE